MGYRDNHLGYFMGYSGWLIFWEQEDMLLEATKLEGKYTWGVGMTCLASCSTKVLSSIGVRYVNMGTEWHIYYVKCIYLNMIWYLYPLHSYDGGAQLVPRVFSIAGFMSLFLSNKLGWCVVFKVQTILDFPAMGRAIRQGAKTSR